MTLFHKYFLVVNIIIDRVVHYYNDFNSALVGAYCNVQSSIYVQ